MSLREIEINTVSGLRDFLFQQNSLFKQRTFYFLLIDIGKTPPSTCSPLKEAALQTRGQVPSRQLHWELRETLMETRQLEKDLGRKTLAAEHHDTKLQSSISITLSHLYHLVGCSAHLPAASAGAPYSRLSTCRWYGDSRRSHSPWCKASEPASDSSPVPSLALGGKKKGRGDEGGVGEGRSGR